MRQQSQSPQGQITVELPVVSFAGNADVLGDGRPIQRLPETASPRIALNATRVGGGLPAKLRRLVDFMAARLTDPPPLDHGLA